MAAKKPTLAQYAKSNTIRTNIALASIVSIAEWALPAMGVTIPMPPVAVVASGFALVNFIIRRWFTKKPLEEK